MTYISLQKWYLFSIVIILSAAAWVWVSRAPAVSATAGQNFQPHKGFAAPDFSLETIDGEEVRLSDLRGQAVLINLWASWCPPCRAEMPALQRVYDDYHDQGLEILAVNATHQDQLSSALSFSQELGLTFPILLDKDGEASRLYQLQSLPTTFFIGRDGKVEDVVIGGPMSEALLRIRVEQLLGE